MAIVDRLRKFLIGFNDGIERRIAEKSPIGPVEAQKNVLSRLDTGKALHLGSGRDKHRLTEEFSSATVVSLDPDGGALMRNENEYRIQGDGAQLPFPDGSFNLVFSEWVFEHLPEPRMTLNEIDRVLKPSGSFVVVVPNPRHYYARIADNTPLWFHYLWLRLQKGKKVKPDTYPTFYNWGTWEDIQLASEQYSWEIANFYSNPGPTRYTKHTPVHVLFALLDKYMYQNPCKHVTFLVHYHKTGRSSSSEPGSTEGSSQQTTT